MSKLTRARLRVKNKPQTPTAPPNLPPLIKADNQGLRYDAGKNQLELIPVEWVWGLGAVLTRGAAKYAPRNWERGMAWGKVLGSALRHIYKFAAGERYDPETGCHHMFMAAWNCCALASYDLREIGENNLAPNAMALLDKVAIDPEKPGT